MDNRRELMEEFFELGATLRSLAEEYRAVMVPIQQRRKLIEAALAGGCESGCASCSPQPHAALTVKGRTLN
jgi:hypothetical protein